MTAQPQTSPRCTDPVVFLWTWEFIRSPRTPYLDNDRRKGHPVHYSLTPSRTHWSDYDTSVRLRRVPRQLHSFYSTAIHQARCLRAAGLIYSR